MSSSSAARISSPISPPEEPRRSSDEPAAAGDDARRARTSSGTRCASSCAGPHVRLLTLTGPGGTGKTRLGLQTAAELLDEFEDGAFFVELAAGSDPALVLPAIAQTLKLKEDGADSLETALKVTSPTGRSCSCSTTSSRSRRPGRGSQSCSPARLG